MDSGMTQNVEISVLIPVFNAAYTLRQALWSAVNQDFESKEIWVYLDGCTDQSAQIANAFAEYGVKVIEGQENRGIVHARNMLVSHAKGKYIAWLDADDLWLPGKLSKQAEYLHAHPEIEVLGTWCEVRNSKHIKAVKWPTQASLLDAWLPFRNPLVQSSLLIRRSSGLQYVTDFEYLEDYYLVQQLTGTQKIAILPAVLCSYLEATKNGKVDKYLKYDFIRKAELILATQLEKLGLKYGKNDLSLLREFLSQNHKIKSTEADTLLRIMKEAKKANAAKGLVQQSALKTVLMLQHMRLFRLCSGLRLRLTVMFILHPYSALRAWMARPRYIKRKGR
jgi:glycosyltransferase involved in cell wall biosynthesis